MPQNLPRDAAVAAADDEDVLGGLMEIEQRPMGDPFMIDALVFFSQLNDSVQDQDLAQPIGLQDHDLLESRIRFRNKHVGDSESVRDIGVQFLKKIKPIFFFC